MKIGKATFSDVSEMVFLSEKKRTIYESYQPVLWGNAGDSAEQQAPYFESLLLRDNHIDYLLGYHTLNWASGKIKSVQL